MVFKVMLSRARDTCRISADSHKCPPHRPTPSGFPMLRVAGPMHPHPGQEWGNGVRHPPFPWNHLPYPEAQQIGDPPVYPNFCARTHHVPRLGVGRASPPLNCPPPRGEHIACYQPGLGRPPLCPFQDVTRARVPRANSPRAPSEVPTGVEGGSDCWVEAVMRLCGRA